MFFIFGFGGRTFAYNQVFVVRFLIVSTGVATVGRFLVQVVLGLLVVRFGLHVVRVSFLFVGLKTTYTDSSARNY